MIGGWTVGFVVLLMCFGGMLLGGLLQKRLPQGQLGEGAREVVKVAMGMIGTLSGLVLGLTITTAKASYDAQRQEIIQLSSKIIALDRTLALLGPDAGPVRADFRALIAGAKERIWPSDGAAAAGLGSASAAELWFQKLHTLQPKDERQKLHYGRALAMANELLGMRWLLHTQSVASISVPFVAVITFWFALIFAFIGLLAPRNALVMVLMLLCALSVAGAVVLAFELDQPFAGLMRMSDEPMRRALDVLGRD